MKQVSKGQKSINFWGDEMLSTFSELLKFMLNPPALHDLFSLINILIFACFNDIEGLVREDLESVKQLFLCLLVWS